MFDWNVQTSEALRRAAGRGSETLFPALCGCKACETTQLIAAPSNGTCAVCGAELSVLTSETTSQALDQEPEVVSPFAA
jgi:transcription initiation factor IIE alpha subunit